MCLICQLKSCWFYCIVNEVCVYHETRSKRQNIWLFDKWSYAYISWVFVKPIGKLIFLEPGGGINIDTPINH